MTEEFYVFIIWLLVFVVVFFLARNYNITWWSSLVLALFIALLVLLAAIHLRGFWKSEDDEESSDNYRKSKDSYSNTGSVILCLLALISVIVVIIYVIQQVFEDTCETECNNKEETCPVNSKTYGNSGKVSA